MGDLDVRVSVVRVLDFAAPAKQRLDSSMRIAEPDRSASVKTRSMFFSVSPMYLLTTRDRSRRTS
jgi:hypothetical protein